MRSRDLVVITPRTVTDRREQIVNQWGLGGRTGHCGSRVWKSHWSELRAVRSYIGSRRSPIERRGDLCPRSNQFGRRPKIGRGPSFCLRQGKWKSRQGQPAFPSYGRPHLLLSKITRPIEAASAKLPSIAR